MDLAPNRYDLIGDIHGHADELVKLLHHLGYKDSSQGYCHESRTVIFLGDFIDRGIELVQHKKLLKIVMTMVQNKNALAVMGNHEFNALAYHTEHKGQFLRPHTEENKKQHQAFLNEFSENSEEKWAVLDFFYSLPLWLDLGDLRVIHACWDEAHIRTMKRICPKNRLDRATLIDATNKGTEAFEAIEVLLKGFEYELPEGIYFKDKGGKRRTAARIQWWKKSPLALSEVIMPDGLNIGDAGKLPVPKETPVYGSGEPPCFIGHYWLNGEPEPLATNVACVDYSVAYRGKLVAYRWDGEQLLDRSKFSYIQAADT